MKGGGKKEQLLLNHLESRVGLLCSLLRCILISSTKLGIHGEIGLCRRKEKKFGSDGDMHCFICWKKFGSCGDADTDTLSSLCPLTDCCGDVYVGLFEDLYEGEDNEDILYQICNKRLLLQI